MVLYFLEMSILFLCLSLRMMEGEMLPVGPTRRRPMPGRPELLNPLWQGREHNLKCSSLISALKPHGVLPLPVCFRCVSLASGCLSSRSRRALIASAAPSSMFGALLLFLPFLGCPPLLSLSGSMRLWRKTSETRES